MPTSQGNQDAIIGDIFAKMPPTHKYYVEFGFNTNQQCTKSGPNTCKLWQGGWRGLLLDGKNENPDINLHAHQLTSKNIVGLFKRYGVPSDFDYLSIDIDSADLWLMRAILASGSFRPRLLSVEYNSNYPWGYAISFIDPTWVTNHNVSLLNTGYRHTCYYGASAHALEMVAREFDYSLVAISKPYDLFYVPQELARRYGLPVIDMASLDWTEPQGPILQSSPTKPRYFAMRTSEAKDLIDYEVWKRKRRQGHTVTQATAVARAACIARLAHLSRVNRSLPCFDWVFQSVGKSAPVPDMSLYA